MSPPITVLLTGAAGQISYALIPAILKGDMFGPNQTVNLHLLDIPSMMDNLKGLKMEIDDCAFPLLNKIVCTDDLATAFSEIDVALMVGSMPRRPGMQRSELLKMNAGIFKAQGAALDKYAKRSVRVLVVGNPANTNCLVMQRCAPSIPPTQFSALTRLDHNRAVAQIAARLDRPVSAVSRVFIWGNHSNTQYPDVSHASVRLASGESVTARAALADDDWVRGEFIKTVQYRGAAVLEARKLSSALSAAKAICDHMRDWWFGTESNGGGATRWVSMAVVSDGSAYGIPAGLVYSFPVTVRNGQWSIVRDLSIDEFSRARMDETCKELEAEAADAQAFIAEAK